MSVRVRVSKKFQIAVPASLRKRLGIKSGDRLLVEVQGDHLILIPEPADYVDRLHGLHKEVWEGIDAQDYVRQERAAWRP